MIQEIKNKKEILAIIIRAKYNEDGIHFFTPDDFSQQLGYMKRPVGYSIPPHIHNSVTREVKWTQEVLFIKSGKVRVDFYNNEKLYLKSTVLNPNDVILLASGGHGFSFIEEGEIIEVKQGPHCGEKDKTRFPQIESNKIRYV